MALLFEGVSLYFVNLRHLRRNRLKTWIGMCIQVFSLNLVPEYVSTFLNYKDGLFAMAVPNGI